MYEVLYLNPGNAALHHYGWGPDGEAITRRPTDAEYISAIKDWAEGNPRPGVYYFYDTIFVDTPPGCWFNSHRDPWILDKSEFERASAVVRVEYPDGWSPQEYEISLPSGGSDLVFYLGHKLWSSRYSIPRYSPKKYPRLPGYLWVVPPVLHSPTGGSHWFEISPIAPTPKYRAYAVVTPQQERDSARDFRYATRYNLPYSSERRLAVIVANHHGPVAWIGDAVTSRQELARIPVHMVPDGLPNATRVDKNDGPYCQWKLPGTNDVIWLRPTVSYGTGPWVVEVM